jgi:hypothetical protein
MMLSTTLGTRESRFGEALGFLTDVHAPGHRPYPEAGLFGPDRRHPGPYDDEIRAALFARGYSGSSCFVPADLVSPYGLVLVAVLVPEPSAPIGRSPDFDSGPILPDRLFPLIITGGSNRGGTGFALNIPPLEDVLPDAGDGFSHVPLSFGASTELDDLAPPVPVGDHSWSFMMRDATGAGWSVTADFVVLPPVETPCDFFGPQATFDDAVPVTAAAVNGRICEAPDFYRIRDPGSYRITVDYEPCAGDLDVHVYDADRNETMVASGPESPHVLDVAGTSYIEVRGATPAAMGPYVLTIAGP